MIERERDTVKPTTGLNSRLEWKEDRTSIFKDRKIEIWSDGQ